MRGPFIRVGGGGTKTAGWVKDPVRTKCAKILEMLYCRSGGQDVDWRSARLPAHNNILPLSIPNPLTPRMPPPSTQSWLRENARLYANPHAVYAHTDALLARFPPIRPKTDVYSSASLSFAQATAHPLLYSLRRRQNPVAALSAWHSPHHLPPGNLQHSSGDLDHSRLSEGTPHPIRRSHSGHAHPL